jgi:hypothetical protein
MPSYETDAHQEATRLTQRSFREQLKVAFFFFKFIFQSYVKCLLDSNRAPMRKYAVESIHRISLVRLVAFASKGLDLFSHFWRC